MNTPAAPGRPMFRAFLPSFLAGWLAVVGTLYAFARRDWVVYHPDTFLHFRWASDLSHRWWSEPLAVLREAVWTIRHLDYNQAGALLVAPVLTVLGTSWPVYLAAIGLVLLGSALLAGQAVLAGCFRRAGLPAGGLWFTVAVLVAHPYFIPAGAVGYICSFGLVPLLGACLLLLSEERVRYTWRLPVMALLLACAVMYRKWYAYWVVAFVVAAGVDALVRERQAGRAWWPALVRAGLWTATLGGLAGLWFFALAHPLGLFILRTDYSDIFAGYRDSHSYGDFLRRQWEGLGGWFTLVALGGTVLAWRHAGTRRAARLFTLVGVLVFALFTRTQDFAPNHLYMLWPSLALLPALGWWQGLQRWRPGGRGWLAAGLAAGCLLAGATVYCPGPVLGPRLDAASLPAFKRLPHERQDLDEIRQLRSDLVARTGGEPERVYTLSSSLLLMPGTLRYAPLTLGGGLAGAETFIESRDVDRWHGFPDRLVRAAYLVVPDPLQLHLQVEHQRVLEVPWRQVRSGQGFGSAFRPVGRVYHLDQGVQVTVYAKQRPLTRDDLEALARELEIYYPDRPYVHAFDAAILDEQAPPAGGP